MSLAVVAKFIDLQEAHIAAGALRAAGFQAEVFDYQFGTVDWIAQNALGGFRLSVPEAELAEARALLADIRSHTPDPEPAAPEAALPERGALRRVAAAAALPMPELAWMVTRRRWYSSGEWLAIVMTALAIVGAVWVVSLAGHVINPERGRVIYPT